jgi:hypothetical protein
MRYICQNPISAKSKFFSYVELYVFLVETERKNIYLAQIGFKLVGRMRTVSGSKSVEVFLY